MQSRARVCREVSKRGIRMGFQWKRIIPFLSSLSAFLPPKQHMTGRAATKAAGGAAPVRAGGDQAQSSGGFPVFLARLERERG